MDSLRHIRRAFFQHLSLKQSKASMKPSFETKDLQDYARFSTLFTEKGFLGEGGDGVVFAYEHNISKALVAVKTPVDLESKGQARKASERIECEIKNLTLLRPHEHITGMLAWSGDHLPLAPAIFLPHCRLGDLLLYMGAWMYQQPNQKKPRPISEVTVWKCLHDMTLALDYMHNNCEDFGYVHNDIKPDNILVDFPKGWKIEDEIPDEPVFKLTDFARMTRYPLPQGEKPKTVFLGTPEFAPPFSEQMNQRPSADIWALGATLQTLALSLFPVQSRESFSNDRRKAGQHVPILMDDCAWRKDCWRALIPTVYRPLCATQEELVRDHDVHGSIFICDGDLYDQWKHRPYSKALNSWYKSMWEKDESKRITAKSLVKYCVPRIKREIRVARSTEKAQECFERAKALREEVKGKQKGRVSETAGISFEMMSVPSYEGSDYYFVEAG